MTSFRDQRKVHNVLIEDIDSLALPKLRRHLSALNLEARIQVKGDGFI